MTVLMSCGHCGAFLTVLSLFLLHKTFDQSSFDILRLVLGVVLHDIMSSETNGTWHDDKDQSFLMTKRGRF